MEKREGPLPVETREGTLLFSDDPGLVQLDVVHGWLSRAYWCEGIPRDTVERAIRHSLVFGAYEGSRQLGFARVVSDRATFAYLCDVIVDEGARGRGIGKGLLSLIHAHPDLQGLRRWLLFTRDAHGLYTQFGWQPVANPQRAMEIAVPDIYRKQLAGSRKPEA